MELITFQNFEGNTRSYIPTFSVRWENKSLVHRFLLSNGLVRK